MAKNAVLFLINFYLSRNSCPFFLRLSTWPTLFVESPTQLVTQNIPSSVFWHASPEVIQIFSTAIHLRPARPNR